jgi:hypothetical protein
MEVLGSVDRGSPNPRRNTSNETFELSGSGNKAATCCRFVAALLPLSVAAISQEATKQQQGCASKASISNQEAGCDEETGEVCHAVSGERHGAPVIQAVLSKEASTTSGTSIRTNQSFGYK